MKTKIFVIFIFFFSISICKESFSNENLKELISSLKIDNKDMEVGKEISNFYENINSQKKPSLNEIIRLKNLTNSSPLYSYYFKLFSYLETIHKSKTLEEVLAICNDSQVNYLFSPKRLKDFLFLTCSNQINIAPVNSKSQNPQIKKELAIFYTQFVPMLFNKNSANKVLEILNENIKKDQSISVIISDALKDVILKNKFLVSSKIAHLIIQPKDGPPVFIVTDSKQSKEITRNFLKKLRVIKKDLYSKNINKESLKNNFINAYSYFKENNLHLLNDKNISNLIVIGKILISRNQYEYSNQIFYFLASTLNTEDHIFNLLWNYIHQGDYNKANESIIAFNLEKNLNTLSPRTLFWMSQIKIKSKETEKAIEYCKLIIQKYPISYHSILASKLIQELPGENNKILAQDFINNFLKSKYNDSTIKINEEQISDIGINLLKRLVVWNKIQATQLSSLEFSMFKELNSINAVLKSSPNGNQDLIKLQTALFISQIQSYFGSYLLSFNTLYGYLDKGEIAPSKELIEALFPVNYASNIKNYKLSIDPNIILSLIRQESAFNPLAYSTAGARGLMQLMPRTARTIKHGISKKNLHNPDINIQIGSIYLNRLLKKYDKNLVYTLAAYNAGEKTLGNWIDNVFQSESLMSKIEEIPFVETRTYVQLIFRNLFFYKLTSNEIKNSQDFSNFLNNDLGLESIIR